MATCSPLLTVSRVMLTITTGIITATTAGDPA